MPSLIETAPSFPRNEVSSSSRMGWSPFPSALRWSSLTSSERLARLHGAKPISGSKICCVKAKPAYCKTSRTSARTISPMSAAHKMKRLLDAFAQRAGPSGYSEWVCCGVICFVAFITGSIRYRESTAWMTNVTFQRYKTKTYSGNISSNSSTLQNVTLYFSRHSQMYL